MPNRFLLAPLLAILSLTVSTGEAAERPNILFCIADDASYPHMGAYGTKWVTTPGFDRVAREGLLFTRAYTPNAKCAPSRSCVLTGRNSWQLDAAANHWPLFPQKFAVYTEVLAENGYRVGKTGKGWGPGIAVDADGKRRNLAGQPFDRLKTKPPAKGISTNDYAGNFETFLEATDGSEPFCFWYGGFEPHRRYEYGSGVGVGGKSLDDLDAVPAFWPDTEVTRNDILDYAFEIEYFDSHLVRMLDSLERRGLLENTLVVVTADNGMPFPRIKGQEYELSNHLPLAIMWPKGIKQPGRTIDDFVSFIDFAPTFIEVAGLNWSDTEMAPTPGHSLTDLFRGERNPKADRDHVLIGKERHDIGRPDDQGYPIRGIVKDEMLYLKNYEPTRWPAGNPETGYLNTDGSPTKTLVLRSRIDDPTAPYWQQNFGKRPAEELFNLKTDPLCLVNLADDPAFRDVKQKLAGQMVRELKDQNDRRLLGEPGYYEAFPYSNERSRNFYNRYMSGEKINAGWVSPTDFEDPDDFKE